jgi:hypothetical protein
MGGKGGGAPAAEPPAAPTSSAPAPKTSATSAPAPKAPAPSSGDFGGEGPAAAPAAPTTSAPAAPTTSAPPAPAPATNATAEKAGQTLYAQIKSQINNLDKKGKQRILQLLTKSLQQSAAPKTAAPAPATAPAPAASKGFKVGADELKQRRQQNIDNDRETTAGLGYNESRILDRNSYSRLKDLLEKADLNLRDFEYRVSISESTPDSITLIPR